MIKESKPISMAEAREYVEKDKNSEINVDSFIKKFTKLNVKEAKELRKKLEDLNLIKMNESSICKVIDALPDNSEEINKIFADVSLNEDETNKIIDIVKEFK